MKKLSTKLATTIKLFPLLLVWQLASTSMLFAQKDNEKSKTNVAFLKQNASVLEKSIRKERQRAFDIAKKKGWPTYQITKQGKIIQLASVDDFGLPVYEATDNEVAAGTTRANTLYTGGGLGLSLSGSTIPNNHVAVWDGGSVLTTHQEFAGGRILVKDGSSSAAHATHVTGTIVAAGINSAAKGMAFGLPQILSYDFNNASSEMSAAAANLLLSNHSYGVVAGWTRNSSQNDRWEFLGNWGENEDYKFGYYDGVAQSWDNICFNAPYYLPLKSAGNYRNVNGPAVGETYYRYAANGTMTNAGARPAGISSNNSYGIIGTFGTAKNILTVGAVNGLRYGSTSPSDVTMSSFSAWGPTDDGRIKPDLVADGVGVISTNNTGNKNYYSSSGTSMSTPNATGTLVLLQELYNQKNGVFMRAATLKGLAIATTSEAGSNLGPDYVFGWGLLNAEKAAKAIMDNATKSLIHERNLTEGETQSINVIASGNGPLAATICWTDPAATAVSSGVALNNTALRLINDLDMRINDGNATFHPWVLNPASPSAAATTGDNFRDNVEQVYIANAIAGKSYTITIGHKNSLRAGNQAYSIIVTGIGGTAYCTSAPVSDIDSKISNFQLSNVNHTPLTNCTSYGDYTSQLVELERGKSHTLNLTVGTCGADQNKIAKVFIDWNGDGDFDDTNELVATSPVISGNGTITQAFAIPITVTVGSSSRIRVVLVETATAADVVSCGSYGKGETQDYSVKFKEAAVNVGVKEIVSPVDGNNAGLTKGVVIKLKNFGTTAQSRIPVNVVVKDGATVIATMNETYFGTIAASTEVNYLLQGVFAAQQGKNYTIEAKTSLVGDNIANDDLITETVIFSAIPIIEEAKAYFTDIPGTYYLNSKQSNGTLFWYAGTASTTSLGNGNAVLTTTAPASNNTYHIGLNDYAGNIGPATKSAFSSSGSYGQAAFRIYFETNQPMEIESARLYIGYPGVVTFNVYNASTNARVSSSTISVTNTRTTASSSTSAANDANDAGRVYNLAIKFPYAGSFYLTAVFDAATLFRSTSSNGSFRYPFTENTDLISIVSNSGGDATAMQQFNYFFYNLKAKPIGERASSRIPVTLTNLQISENGNTLTSPISEGNQWYLNGNIIDGAISPTYQASQMGDYMVKVTLPGGTTITSQVYQLNVLPVVLKYFKLYKRNNGALLNWETLSEINNEKFLIERSNDGINFSQLHDEKPNSSKYYTYLDKNPNIGLNYYRIKQIDINGKNRIFGPLQMMYEALGAGLLLYENPVRSHFTLQIHNVNTVKSYQVEILDVKGRKLKSVILLGKELVTGYQINASNFTAGTYILNLFEVETKQRLESAKFIKL